MSAASSRRMVSVVAWGLSLGATAAPSVRADPAPEDKALATTLFKEGRALLEEGRVGEACRKLEESQRVDPGGGTLLNVAVCHEREGRTASAWAEYTEALTLARRDGRGDRAQLATQRIAALEPNLSRLAVEVPPGSDAPDLEVRRDASVVRRPAWGIAMPVDPGSHVISATAPGKRAWSVAVAVGAGAPTTRVVVPPLESAPAERSYADTASASASPEVEGLTPPTTSAPPANTSTRKSVGGTLLAAGGTALLAGSVFGLLALSDHERSRCAGTLCPTPDGVSLESDSRRLGDASTVALVLGGAALIAGGYLWLTAPTVPSRGLSSLTLAPSVDRDSASLWLRGRWE